MRKRALLVGIDEYDNRAFPTLYGCVNDVEALVPLLSRNEDESINFQCQKLTSSSGRVERKALLNSIESLLAPGSDVALLYFAGHGGIINNDLFLVAQNGDETEMGVSFSSVMTKIQASKVPEIIVLLDCCYSGTAGELPQIGANNSYLKEGVSILTASRKDQFAEENEYARGIFSTYLCGALEGGAADVLGYVTLAGIYSYLSESFGAWSSRPTFKANVEELHIIRHCESAIPLHELRRLNTLFVNKDFVYPLDPSYEPTVEPKGHPNEKIFGILQRCRAAKLLVPVGFDHMYDAAMNSTGCKLTPLGKRYWNLAKQDLL